MDPSRGEDTEREDRGGRGGRGGKGKEAKHKARPPATKEYIERESTRLKTSLDSYLAGFHTCPLFSST